MSILFVDRAQHRASFPFHMLQSDHGPEFSSWFTHHLSMTHRHTRVGKPNDNAHVERFNRTLQDECLHTIPQRRDVYASALPRYLRYYNMERMHMGIDYKTPQQKVAELFPGSWG
jgi:transposase InsO family protein